MVMKTLAFIVLLMPLMMFGQIYYECPNATQEGFLKSEVNSNSVILRSDSACRNCGSIYEMEVLPLEGDTLAWYQLEQLGGANCDCVFNLSVTLDSLNPGNYYVKTFFGSFPDVLVYCGLISFVIEEQNTYNSLLKSDQYQSECFNVGTDEHRLQRMISLSPNPAAEQLTLIMNGIRDKATYQIFTISGLITQEGHLNLGKTQIDVSFMPDGVYFVRVQDEKGVQVAKLIIQ
jgi:hypothetical protein